MFYLELTLLFAVGILAGYARILWSPFGGDQSPNQKKSFQLGLIAFGLTLLLCAIVLFNRYS
jgi:hypothetical protein